MYLYKYAAIKHSQNSWKCKSSVWRDNANEYLQNTKSVTLVVKSCNSPVSEYSTRTVWVKCEWIWWGQGLDDKLVSTADRNVRRIIWNVRKRKTDRSDYIHKWPLCCAFSRYWSSINRKWPKMTVSTLVTVAVAADDVWFWGDMGWGVCVLWCKYVTCIKSSVSVNLLTIAWRCGLFMEELCC